MDKIQQLLEDLYFHAGLELYKACDTHAFKPTAANLRKVQKASHLLSEVVAMCEANGVEVK